MIKHLTTQLAKDLGCPVDADWTGRVEKVSVTPHRRSNHQAPYIPAIPLAFLQEIQAAGDAVPVVLVAYMLMRMQARSEIALGSAVWSRVGNPSPRVRSRLLRQIQSISPEVCNLQARVGKSYLLCAGPRWPGRFRKAARSDTAFGDSA